MTIVPTNAKTMAVIANSKPLDDAAVDMERSAEDDSEEAWEDGEETLDA